MSAPKIKNIIFYLSNNKGTFYAANLNEPIAVNIPGEIMSNLDILDQNKLNALIATTASNELFKSANIIILLDTSVTFEEDFTAIPESLQPAAEEKFLSLVPLHRVLSKKYTINKKTKLIVTNNDLTTAFINAFKTAALVVTGVIPASIVNELIPALHNALDSKTILEKTDKILPYSLTTPAKGAKSGRASIFKSFRLFSKK